MAVLTWFEALRTPFLNTLFLAVTQLGEVTAILLTALTLLWCVDKRSGYFLMYIGIAGMGMNLLLKQVFTISRPWIRDPGLSTVPGARETATGYSFPSGHTQNVTTTFGGLARLSTRRAPRIAFLCTVALVAVSRMYLGVHTPADVLFSLALGGALVLVGYPVSRRAQEHARLRIVLRVALIALTLGIVAGVHILSSRASTEALFASDALKNAYTALGIACGYAIVRWTDERVLHFSTHCVWWAQILKLLLGLGVVLLAKEGLKAPLHALTRGHPLGEGLRYLLVTLTAGVLWPLTFRFWARLGATHQSTR